MDCSLDLYSPLCFQGCGNYSMLEDLWSNSLSQPSVKLVLYLGEGKALLKKEERSLAETQVYTHVCMHTHSHAHMHTESPERYDFQIRSLPTLSIFQNVFTSHFKAKPFQPLLPLQNKGKLIPNNVLSSTLLALERNYSQLKAKFLKIF